MNGWMVIFHHSNVTSETYKMKGCEKKPRTVIVVSVTYLKRNEVYRARAALKGTGIYLNEDFIEKRYQLLMSTKKKQGAQNVWNRDGKKVGNHVEIINEESDLMKADEKL
ncbi:hypothetical protein JTB14_024645 [Gonioctena quinquepunctata]|nr:hypothetical protein JTB14_024645 [Gonioctena quinquepunctata]